MKETRKIRLFEIRRTERAVLFRTTPKENREGDEHWLPLLEIEHISKFPTGECVVTIPEWLADSRGL